jgi:hypothetical protein
MTIAQAMRNDSAARRRGIFGQPVAPFASGTRAQSDPRAIEPMGIGADIGSRTGPNPLSTGFMLV